MPDLRIFELEFENTIVIFKITVLKFVLLQNLVQKKNSLNLEPKIPDLSILDCNMKIIFLSLQSPPSNFSNWKIW